MQIHWIWLAGLSKLPIQQKLALLERFSDPEEIFYRGAAALREVEGATREMAQELEQRDLSQAESILRSCKNKNIGILTYFADAYPARLRNIADPPLVLYYRGKLPDTGKQPVISVVGTRKATAYGLNIAHRMGQQLAACGALVVSGGASGIDTMALRGALELDVAVVAVLGGGADVVYPKSNRKLFERILDKGCLISEYAPGTPSYGWNFPRRNRILSGMANGVLVVEAPEQSGALITARNALEQGRDVFVVPGNIDVKACAGSNALLQGYAMAAFTGWDVVGEYQLQYPDTVEKRQVPAHIRDAEFTDAKVAQTPAIPAQSPSKKETPPDKPAKPLSQEEAAVVACLTDQPQPVDAVIARSGLPAARVMSILTVLSVKGVVCTHPGKRISLKQ